MIEVHLIAVRQLTCQLLEYLCYAHVLLTSQYNFIELSSLIKHGRLVSKGHSYALRS
jgi:hypothetical protein